MAEEEKTQREMEFEMFGIALEELEKMVKTKAKHRNAPIMDVMIDWLEFAQLQLDEKYINVNHTINRTIYLLHCGMLMENPDWKVIQSENKEVKKEGKKQGKSKAKKKKED